MRRLALRAVVAVSLPALFAAPVASAQYSSRSDEAPAAIALFSDENFYGDIRDVYDPFSTLNDLSFNDRTRSVAVFAGQWELCEDKNFTGRCVFIKEDVSDLGWFGLNGRITSVRPIYEYTEASHGLMFSRDRYGYIRYANDETFGYDTWNYGYASSWGISTYHFGYSPDYYRYGYYSPTWGYDPYGFAWGPRGKVRYTSVYRRHPRPLVVNPYWSGWDWHRSDWRKGHWSWRGDDHHDWRGKDRDYGGGRDWRRDGWKDDRKDDDRGSWRGDGQRDDRPERDRPGDRYGPGEGGTRTGGRIPETPVTTDPRPDRGGWSGRDGRSGSGDAVSVPPADSPRPPRGDRLREAPADTGALLGGPGADEPRGGDEWRGRGRSGEEGGRWAGRMGGERIDDVPVAGRSFDRPEPEAYSPPPPPPPEVRREAPPEAPREASREENGGGWARVRGGFPDRNGDE